MNENIQKLNWIRGAIACSPDPLTRIQSGYNDLIGRYGKDAFRAACAKAKFSPLSVQDILERDHQPKTSAHGIHT